MRESSVVDVVSVIFVEFMCILRVLYILFMVLIFEVIFILFFVEKNIFLGFIYNIYILCIVFVEKYLNLGIYIVFI